MDAKALGNPWSVTRRNDNTAGVVEVIGAPTPPYSHYITDLVISQGQPWDVDDPDGFTILRRQCPYLDSGTDTITVTDHATLQMATGDLSLELWFRWVSGAVAAVPGLLSKLAGGNDGYLIELTSLGLPKVTIGDGVATAVLTGTRPVSDGIWHHICVTCDRNVAAGLILYIDGQANAVSVDGEASDPTAVTGNVTGTGTNLVMTGVASRGFCVAGVGVYKGLALAAATVVDRFSQRTGGLVLNAPYQSTGAGKKFSGSETSLSCGLVLDEGNGSIGYDMTSNSNDATLANVTWYDDGFPFGDLIMQNSLMFPAYSVLSSVKFQKPMKIGAGSPLRLLETDGSWQVTINGYTD